MWCYSFVTLLLFASHISSSATKINASIVASKSDALAYLNKFGYNPCSEGGGVLCSISLTGMLTSFQKRFHLKTTGVLDEATKQEMSRPRCGNKDPPLTSLKSSPSSLILKWTQSTLTWSLRNYPLRISAAETQKIMEEAFHAWFQHIPLNIKQVCSTCSAKIVIDFNWGEHGDRYSFDGTGGTLAHAFFPQDGRIHFDVEEPWTTSFNGYDINLYLVAVHEIGHALGLEHVFERTSLMYPNYQLMSKKDILPYFDRIQIQNMYGSVSKKPTTRPMLTQARPVTKTSTTTTRRTTTTTKTTRRPITTTTTKTTTRSTERTTPSIVNRLSCQLFIDAAFDFPDNTFHALDIGLFRRYLPNKLSWDKSVRRTHLIYHNLPNRINGGAYDFVRNEVFIFTSTRVYQYRVKLSSHQIDYRRNYALPDHLHGIIVGAIYYQDSVHIVTSKGLQVFDINRLQTRSIGRKLSEEFPGFSGSVKAAFTYGYLHHFFTSDRLVYVWDEQFNRWKTLAKPMETSWFACERRTQTRRRR